MDLGYRMPMRMHVTASELAQAGVSGRELELVCLGRDGNWATVPDALVQPSGDGVTVALNSSNLFAYYALAAEAAGATAVQGSGWGGVKARAWGRQVGP